MKFLSITKLFFKASLYDLMVFVLFYAGVALFLFHPIAGCAGIALAILMSIKKWSLLLPRK